MGALVRYTDTDQLGDLILAGGSGYGDPWSRSYEDVQNDLDAGYVSVDGAETDYGCVVGADGQIDRTASKKRRSSAPGVLFHK